MAMILVSLGIIEFGRAYQVRTELTFLADRAARLILNDWDVTDASVRNAVKADFVGDRDSLTVTFTRDSETYSDGSKVVYRNIEVSYPFILLIPQLSTSAITLTARERVPET
jgi:Flp pilus assembly protein TadG